MSDVPLEFLFAVLFVLIFCSAFFSGSETGLMAINRYRLRHQAESGDRGAQRVVELLKRPDRLIGLILLGNNFVNNLATSLGALIAIRLMGEAGVGVAALILTLVLLIFSEVTPKTIAALHPERFAYPASLLLLPLLRFFYPLVNVINSIVNLILKPLGFSETSNSQHSLSPAELRTVVLESSGMLPRRHRDMLLSILDLEAVTIDDIMVPRAEVDGIDLADPWEQIVEQIRRSTYSRLPVHRGGLDQVQGILHLRAVLGNSGEPGEFDRAQLESILEDPYFVPEGTPLQTQLLNFQRQQKRVGLVVDEYGDIQGLVTLEDILEEIVGEFTTDPISQARRHIVKQEDGSHLVDGATPIRLLNRSLGWDLPTDGPKTINGLIMEYLEAIPEPGTGLLLAGHPVEIVKISGNRVKTALIREPIKPADHG